MPQWSVTTADGKEFPVPQGARLNLIFTSADDLVQHVNGLIQPVAAQFGLEVIMKKKGLAVVKPG